MNWKLLVPQWNLPKMQGRRRTTERNMEPETTLRRSCISARNRTLVFIWLTPAYLSWSPALPTAPNSVKGSGVLSADTRPRYT